ncbi:HBL/NHE enterotoxin family protein [Enterovibrio sp. Hal110]
MLSAILNEKTNPLSPPQKANDQLRSTQTARMILDAYSTGVLEQPDVDLDLIPSLKQDQINAKNTARRWPSLSTELIQTNTNLIHFGHSFDNYFDPLYELAGCINEGDNKDKFIDGMKKLISKINSNKNSADLALKELITFQNDVLKDHAAITNDYNLGVVKYKGTEGEISKLTERNKALSDGMNADNMMMGFGATGAVVGGLIIAVGALGEFATAGLSTGLVVAGIGVAAGGTGVAIYGGVDYAKKLSDYKDNLEKLAKDNAEIAQLDVLKGQFDNFLNMSNEAVNALRSMVGAWQTLETQYNTVIEQLSDEVSVDDDTYIQTEMKIAKDDWDDLMETAKLIQAQCMKLQVHKDTDPGQQKAA